MTEAEWLACGMIDPMLEQLGESASLRRLRLFAAACSRRVVHLLPHPRFVEYIDLVEGLADDTASEAEAANAVVELESAHGWNTVESHACASICKTLQYGRYGAAHAWEEVAIALDGEAFVEATRIETGGVLPEEGLGVLDGDFLWSENWFGSGRLRCDVYGIYPKLAAIFREVFGNPLNPPDAFSPPPAAVAIAQAAYDERELPIGHLDNARLAVLSDALEEAGCTDEAVLRHLRSPGPHVRGCWALDLVLAKDR